MRSLRSLLLLAAIPLAAATTVPASAQSCDPSYPTVCIPPVWEAGDLDCYQVAAAAFTVYQPDPHSFDGDFDGIGCEWN